MNGQVTNRAGHTEVAVGEHGRDADRELDELLSELRVVLPAVTVLFAFLLTLPFTTRFTSLTAAQRTSFFIAFVSTAIAVVLLAGEVAYHRLRGHPYDKREMIATASRQTVAALVLLGAALVAVVFLVTDVLYAGTAAASLAAAVAVLAVLTWFAIPLARRRREEGPSAPEGERPASTSSSL